MVSVLVALTLLACVILVHELGHYLAARLVGIRIVTFSIGMGPRLLERRIGDTVFCLSAFPLGGYVRPFAKACEGDSEHQSPPPRLFRWLAPSSENEQLIVSSTPSSDSGNLLHASYPAKLFFLINGLLLNLVAAYGVYISTFYAWGIYRDAVGVQVASVEAGSVAEAAGFLPGDEIASLNGDPVASWSEVARTVSAAGNGSPIAFRVVRPDRTEVTRLMIRPEPQQRSGFKPVVLERSFTLAEAFTVGSARFARIAGTYVHQMLTFNVPMSFGLVENLQELGQMASHSVERFLTIFVIFSIVIVCWNAIPYPAFDGGQILFLLVEWARGKELDHLLKQRLVHYGLVSCLLLYAVMIGADALSLAQ